MLWLVSAILWGPVVSLSTWIVTPIATVCPLLCSLDSLFWLCWSLNLFFHGNHDIPLCWASYNSEEAWRDESMLEGMLSTESRTEDQSCCGTSRFHGLPSLCLISGTLERAKRRPYYVQSTQKSTLGEQGMKREIDEQGQRRRRSLPECIWLWLVAELIY